MSGNYKVDDSVANTGADEQTYTIYGLDGTEYQLKTSYDSTAYAAGPPEVNAEYTLNYELLDKDGNALATPVSGTQALTFDPLTEKNTTAALDLTGDGNNINFELNFNGLSRNSAPTSVSTKVDKNEDAEVVTGTVTIYDSLGSAHSLSIKYTHIDKNAWSWEVETPSTGTLDNASPNESYGTILFNTDGTIDQIKQGTTLVSTLPEINFKPESGADAMTAKLDFGSGTNGITQTSLGSQVQALSQDGSSAASLANLNVDQYGKHCWYFY